MDVVQFANCNIIVTDQEKGLPVSDRTPDRLLRSSGAVFIQGTQFADLFDGTARGTNYSDLEADSNESQQELSYRKPLVGYDD